ncbi:hypothetical protein NPA31_011825 [Aurantimonas sp. MSK8Z-1]|uniref:hypothetical protein n=1 Tax=Mangrovibrevibacter kandeliae TaxID=2968473 RepID=UPI002117BDC6|nr:hypothetical protein [Aurantimonas sp. MSK8Z-1]MCW4115652.1 hypothetical protein [Aurantimonas sp. MSK8Z-1]
MTDQTGAYGADRARAIQHYASQFPHWGDYRGAMTEAEAEWTHALWLRASEVDGSLSFGSIVNCVARGVDPLNRES